MEQSTIVLGDEYDRSLQDALRKVLENCGAIIFDKEWNVGGSQEIETFKVKLDDDIFIVVESETYMGLSIVGPKGLVESIAEKVNKQLRR